MSNERKTGSVVLVKTDDTDAKVGGASYALYYRKAGETDDTQYGIYETGSDRNADNYGEIHIAGLPWGDYYFVEAKAPVGYDLNTEHVTFSIGRDSVQNTVYLETVDQRSKGSIRLTKRDKNNPSKHLQGATSNCLRQMEENAFRELILRFRKECLPSRRVQTERL